jgi:hypothetical protein
MPSWADLNERQQKYLHEYYDQDQENEGYGAIGYTRESLDYIRGQRKGKKEHTTPGGFLWQTN